MMNDRELMNSTSSPVRRLWQLANVLERCGVTSPELRQIVERDEPGMQDCHDLYQCLAALTPMPAVDEPVDPLTHVLFNVRYAAMLFHHLGTSAPAPLALLSVAERRAELLSLSNAPDVS